jgi:hypothetical protein
VVKGRNYLVKFYKGRLSNYFNIYSMGKKAYEHMQLVEDRSEIVRLRRDRFKPMDGALYKAFMV